MDRRPKNIPIKKRNMTITNEDENRSRSVLTREPERLAREVDTRVRDDFYDLPEVDVIDGSVDVRRIQLLAPPPRIDDKHGKMRQHWVAHKQNNGHRIHQLMELNYRVRHPSTVPPSFKHFCESWQGKDVIMVAGDHILMETSERNYLELQRRKTAHNDALMRGIKESHGQIVRDGEIAEFKDRTAGTFSQEVVVNHNNSEGDVKFAD